MNELEFASLFEFIRNGMNVKQDKSGEGLPISRIETISDGTVNPDRVGFAGLRENQCANWLLRPGDILFSHINSVEHIGKCAVFEGFPEKLVHGMNLLCLRPNAKVVDSGYAKYLIRSQEFRGKLASFINKAVNQASVSIGNLRTIKVHLPPLPDQRRIAAILDQAEALRAKRRTALAKLDTLAQSIFIEMFGDPATGNRWKGTFSKNFEDCSDFLSGFAWRSEGFTSDTSGIPIIRIQNVGQETDRDFVYWRGTYDDRFLIRNGDILLTMSGSFRADEWSGPEALLNQRIVKLIPKRGVESRWLLFATKMALGNIAALGRHALVSNVALSDLRTLPLPTASMEEQRDFVVRIEAVGRIRTAAVHAEMRASSLFASLQHRAFRGEL